MLAMFFSRRSRRPHHDRKPRPIRLPFRPILEVLEDRITPTGSASPTTNADGNGPGTLRYDIQTLANANPNNDFTITLAAGTTYNLNLGALKLNNTNGRIIIQGQGAGSTVISANNTSGDLTVANGTTVILQNLSLQGGKSTTDFTASGTTATGGGLANAGGTVVLSNVSLTGNVADATGTTGGTANGGGIFTDGGTLVLNSVTLSQNKAKAGAGGGAFGGGIGDVGATVYTNIPSAPNAPASPLPGPLTASFNPSSLNKPLLTLSGNSALGGNGSSPAGANGGNGGSAFGGGFYANGGAVTLVAISASGNTALGGKGGKGADAAAGGFNGGTGGSGEGGGVYGKGGLTTFTVQASTLSGNFATGGGSGNGGNATGAGPANGGSGGATAGLGAGGGLLDADATDKLAMFNDTVSGNTATGGTGGSGGSGAGAGIAGNGGAAGAAQGGGLAFLNTGNNGQSVTNVTVAYNTVQAGQIGSGKTPGAPAAASGGGVFSTAAAVGAAPVFINTLIAGNGGASIGPDETGNLSSTSKFNLISNNSGSTAAFAKPNTNNNIISTNTGLAASLGNNGGPTLTLALSGGLAIGNGDSTQNAGIGGQDQRGGFRTSTNDIGAFQTGTQITPPPPPVSPPPPPPPVSPPPPPPTPSTFTFTAGGTSGNITTYPASTTSIVITVTVSSPTTGDAVGGTVLFTLTGPSPSTNIVFSQSVAVNANGQATVTLALPGDPPPGSYTLTATYTNANGTFTSSGSETLTFTQAADTLTLNPVTAFSASSANQSLSVSATDTSPDAPGGKVNEGQVTFGLYNGNTQIGTSVTANVSAGATLPISLTVPGGTPAGANYTLKASYSDAANGNNFAPETTSTPVTITTAAVNLTPVALTTLNASDNGQNESVSAGVNSPTGGTVGTGAVTFTLFNSAGAQVGNTVTANVVGGQTVSQQLAIPGATPAGTYTLKEAYADTAGVFATGSGQTTLTINPSATTVTPIALPIAAPVASENSQGISVAASVSSPTGGTVGSGAVTFSLFNSAGVQVGTAVTANVTGGQTGTQQVILPGGTPAGTYTLKEAYADNAGVFASSNNQTTLTINPATVSLTAGALTSITTSASPQNIAVSANVSSGTGGAVVGAVTFTAFDANNVQVGSPVTFNVVGGTASGNLPLTLPSNGTLTIKESFADSTGVFAANSGQATTLTINLPPAPPPPPPAAATSSPPAAPPSAMQLFLDGITLANDLTSGGGISAVLANTQLIADILAAQGGLFNPFLDAGFFSVFNKGGK
jgi:hypothetical protein